MIHKVVISLAGDDGDVRLGLRGEVKGERCLNTHTHAGPPGILQHLSRSIQYHIMPRALRTCNHDLAPKKFGLLPLEEPMIGKSIAFVPRPQPQLRVTRRIAYAVAPLARRGPEDDVSLDEFHRLILDEAQLLQAVELLTRPDSPMRLALLRLRNHDSSSSHPIAGQDTTAFHNTSTLRSTMRISSWRSSRSSSAFSFMRKARAGCCLTARTR